MPRRRAGAGVYTYYLTRALAAALPRGDELFVFDRWGAFADLATLPGVSVRQVRRRGRAERMVWEQTALPAALRSAHINLFHSPHHSLPAVPWGGRTVVTVHDVTFRLLPWRYTRARRLYMSAITRLASARADHMIVPSTSVARDLADRYRRTRGRIAVVPEAPPPHIVRVEDEAVLARVRERYRLPPRFVLSVGTVEPGKNRGALTRAMGLLREQGLPHELVVVGQRGWGADAVPDARVHLTDYVPDDDLAALYTLADAFAFPSWREGFGLPPLEALACGTPVVSSSEPAMPEILGDAALYAPPDRPDELARQLASVLTDTALAARFRQRGLERARLYSWERAAAETLAVYARVMRTDNRAGLTE